MNKFKILSITLAVSISLTSTQSQAFFCANCANVVQMAQLNVSAGQSLLKQIQQTYNSVQSLKYQIQNMKNLKNLEWGDIQSQLNSLNTIASRGKSLSYAMGNVSQQWDNLFVGVDGYQSQNPRSINSVETFKKQGDALRDTAKSALEMASEVSRYQQDDLRNIQRIQGHVGSADGAVKIMQANAELLAQLSQQLQKLQSLTMAQIQMSSTYIAAQADREERQRVASEKMLSQKPQLDPNNGKDWSKEWQSPPIKW
ncbi:P-type conjugative transfer protein TrbJ [Vibrio parahaemolyticus]|nr:P-type conjugative transfer protein TrbJ [Vibrio parahaemolyticus]EJG1127867.1 P-type conjugative transfer protein TrbJ [Vibrio parahaemolyticus]